MDERRVFSRLNFPVESSLLVEGDTYQATLVDISVKGALVEKPSGWVDDTDRDVTLRIQLQDSDVVVEMKVEVVRSGEEQLGLRCKSIDLDSLTHLRRILELNLGDTELVEREFHNLD
jgi:hypothetical protein